MHSLGPKMGYALPHRSIFNPIDYVLVNMQKVFPLDFILIFVITWFLIMCTLSGIRNLGVWIGFVRVSLAAYYIMHICYNLNIEEIFIILDV